MVDLGEADVTDEVESEPTAAGFCSADEGRASDDDVDEREPMTSGMCGLGGNEE